MSYKRLGFEIPGSGLALVLNPPSSAGAGTEFPVSLSWSWEILRYADGLSFDQFDFSPRSLFDLLLRIVKLNYTELVKEVVTTFIGGTVDDFITRFTTAHPSISLVVTPDADVDVLIENLVDALEAQSVDILDVIFNDYLLDADIPAALRNVALLFSRRLGSFSEERLRRMLTPEVSASIDAISVGIQFPPIVLREVDAAGEPLPDPQNPGQDNPTMVTFDVASLSYSTAKGLEFDLAQNLNINFPRSEILKTGLILDVHGLKVDFSRTTNIPEAIADGRSADFVGVYVMDGTISFPAFWNEDAGSTAKIKARNLLIGTGGFSGTLALEATVANVAKPVVRVKFGENFSISLDKFSITFKQNAITGSTVEGTLVIPGFKDANNNPADIRIKVAIRQDGDFDVTAHEDDGFKPITFPGVFVLTLKSVFFGKRDDDFYLGVSGSIQFTHHLLAGIAKDPIEVEKLIIWSDGRFEIEGGTIPLPQNIHFPIGPAELSISAIHLGSHQRVEADGTTTNFRYFGFDGGVDINPGGVDVRGKGIKFYFPVNGPLSLCYLEIKSLAIDLVIPGSASKDSATLLISGFLSVGGTGGDPEYEGGVSFSLPKAKIAGGAAMKYRPKKPAFLVDAFVELSTPIPLGATSLGIYGFRGLFGMRYVATKHQAGVQETDTWFDFYKARTPPDGKEGVTVSKFEIPDQTAGYDSTYSIGAGVSLATAQDSGKTFSCKLFLLLSLPDLIYLEGKANILGERVGLTGEDPPFFALLAISSQSVELGAGVNYKLPKEGANQGQILDLSAEMRAAFFFQNSSAWYINMGTVQKPTTARVLTLFDATSYLMLSAAGIAAGAGVSYGFSKSYAGGLVHASVGVYIKVGGFISFERPQIGGFAMLGGHVDVSLMWLSFYIVIDTSLSVEVPKPFYVRGSVHLCVGITIGFWKFKKHIEKCFDVEFKWERDPSVDTTPVLPFKDMSNPNALPPVSATNMLSGETFKVVYLGTSLPSAGAAQLDGAVLPLDTWVDLEFLKGLLPGPAVDARIGRLSGQAPANSIDYVPPAEVAHKVKHEYAITALEIKAWNGNAWVDYRPYQAMSPPAALAALAANPAAYKDGFWMNSGAGFNKIRLLAETSLSYMQQGQPGWYVPEQMGITSATLFCQTKLRDPHCITWAAVPPGTVYPDGKWQQMSTVLYRVAGGTGTVIDWNGPAGVLRSLIFANEATAQIVFNKPCAEVDLKLTTFSSGAALRFYKRETVGATSVYTLVETRSLTQLQLLAPVRYDHPEAPVAKVEIEPVHADPAVVYASSVQIEALHREVYEGPAGAATDALRARVQGLEQDLARIRSTGCSPNGITADPLGPALQALQSQVEECHRQLAGLQAAQTKACKEAADFRGRFARCFPHVPSAFSYDLVEERDAAGRSQLRFSVYDDQADAVLLNGLHRYPDAAAAERAMIDTLERARSAGAYAIMNPRAGQYFFHIVDASRTFTAASPALFATLDELIVFTEKTRAMLQAVPSLAPARRVAGKLPCPRCQCQGLDHLDCWSDLEVVEAIDPHDCHPISVVSAHDLFCRQYDKLYRELYAANQHKLDELTRRCEELTREVESQSAACQALSDQLAAVQQLLGFVNGHGPLRPPDGYPCSTLLHEVCCLSLDDHQLNLTVPGQAAIEQDYGNAVQAIEKWLTPVWRPDTTYSIRLQVRDTVNGSPTPARDFYFGFRTAGPVGYFHTDPKAGYVMAGKTPDQYLLTGLKGYIDYRRSYPNADGELIRAKPLFYEDARILLFFTKRYVYHFFGSWPAYNGLPALTGNEMQIVVKDPAENTSIPNPPPPNVTTTAIPQAVVSWPADDDPRIPEDVRTLLNLRNPELLNPDFVGGKCWTSGGDMIKPASVYTQVTPRYLKPLKLYTAIVNNVYQGRIQEVHRYVFQTSRYPDFAAQVNSYRLDDGKGNQRDAVFRIDVPLTVADVNLMYDVVTGNLSAPNAALAGTWADPFDRLVEGVLARPPLDAAAGTEFNVVRNSTTNAVVAVWVRNPEPFNDPKLPDDVLPRTLRVMQGLSPDLAYQVLFSKDRSQAFVMHPSKGIPVTQMKLRFAYVEWDGSDYVDRTVVVTGTLPTNV
ncbi:MAG: hypothetical protein JF614_31760 [Acidobacteria bacterium]|nr:hypothetical protein [Acidobacteriota bacterium]